MQPAGVVALAIAGLIIGCFVLDPRAALVPLFLWLLMQNSVASMLEARGLAGVATWLRRSDEPIILVLMAATLMDQMIRRGRVNLYGLGLPVVALTAIAAVCAALVGHAPGFVAVLDLVLLLKGVLIFVVLAHMADDTERPFPTPRVVQWVLGAGLASFGIACVEAIDPGSFRAFLGLPTALYVRAGWSSLQGPFVHPGVFGWWMGVCALGCLVLALEGDRRGWWGMALFVLGVVASGRRKPLVGVFVAALLLIWLASPGKLRWRRVGGLLLATAAVVALFWPLVSDLVTSGIHDYLIPRNPLEQARNVMYLAAAGLAWQHFPLGVGPGLFGGYAARLYYSPLYSQLGLNAVWGLSQQNPSFLNDAFWPHVLGEFGLLGLGAFWLFLIRSARDAVLEARGSDRANRILARFGLAVMFEALMESVASATFEASLQALVTFGLLALATGARAARQRADGPTVGVP